MIPDEARSVADAIAAAGGHALLVGGWVRDSLREGEHAGKDLDFEVYGLDLEALERVLGRYGRVLTVGRAFGVLRSPRSLTTSSTSQSTAARSSTSWFIDFR